jgi:hypothetical protein
VESKKKKEKIGKYCKHCGEEIGYDRSQGLYFCGTCPFTQSEKKEDLVKMEGSEHNQALEDIKTFLNKLDQNNSKVDIDKEDIKS